MVAGGIMPGHGGISDVKKKSMMLADRKKILCPFTATEQYKPY